MALPEMLHFPLAKVRAYRAYFSECRTAARGTPEANDLDVTVKLCDQLLALMVGKDDQEGTRKAGFKKPAAAPGEQNA